MTELNAPAKNTSYSGEGKATFDGWQRDVARSFLPLRLSLPTRDTFSARLRAAGSETLHLAEITASSHTVERTRDLIADSGADYFKLSFQVAGTGLMVQGNRELVLRPGEMTIYDTSKPYSLVFEDDFRFLVAMFPRHAVQFRKQDVEELSAIRMDGTTGVGSLVSTYLTGLSQNLSGLTGPTGSRLSQIGLDLIAALVDNQLSEAEVGTRSVLKRQIYAYMLDNLWDPDLDPANIAAANFISVRFLHSLFKEEGATVAAWIRQQRLERCRHELRDASLTHLSVSEIAARWGMHDAGHFSKMFKACYAVTPSQWRSSAAKV